MSLTFTMFKKTQLSLHLEKMEKVEGILNDGYLIKPCCPRTELSNTPYSGI